MRLYFFVLYNISPIQAGIQAGHAALEYVLLYGNTDKRVGDFMRDHKTFILLNGGSHSTMFDRMDELDDLGIPFAEFREPDLNDAVTAISFLVEEKDYADEDILGVNPITQYLKKFHLARN